ncbi:hypothetical protein [Aquimarina longa]|uniref:hypothetical protein n=1 Tax=Aquimarina longa TaxID=1080221 RepID=UPI0007833427|nr:hypothetical protein [Aquimarina longa]
MRVEDYKKDHIITDKDEFFGSDGDNKKKTVNFSATAIAKYVKEKIGLNQNNKVKVVILSESELSSNSPEGLSKWINTRSESLIVKEDELVFFEIEGVRKLSQNFLALFINTTADIEATTLYFEGDGKFPTQGDYVFYDSIGKDATIDFRGYFYYNPSTKIGFITDNKGRVQFPR